MIHLRAENWSSLGDDTFWCWAERSFPDAVKADLTPVAADDHVLHYGLLGAPERNAESSVALLWEQHPEMEREVAAMCRTSWRPQIAKLHAAAAACARRTVATPLLADEYAHHGPVDVLPIGVDTELWCPAESYQARHDLRDRFRVPRDVRLGFWGGHDHPMKGWDLFERYAAEHPDTWWVLVFKHRRRMPAVTVRGIAVSQVEQPRLAKLLRMCDFALFTSRLRPYSMLEWEAMSCNLPVVNVGHPEREFTPGPDPRVDVFDRRWDRTSARALWLEYLGAT